MATLHNGMGGPSGYGTNSFKSNGVDTGNLDDGSVQIDVTSVFGAGGIDFYGEEYESIYVSSNGLICLGGFNNSFSPVGMSGYNEAAFAAFWADIDITKGGDIYWDVDATNGHITITWDGVAPYSGSFGSENTFQVRLSNLGSGDLGVEFLYNDIQWANNATAGITDGGSNDYEVPGSGNASAMSNYPSTDFGQGEPAGVYAYGLSGGVVACFAQGTLITTSRGEIPIEQIAVGDYLETLDFGPQPVLWTGQHSVRPAQLALHDDLRPVIIRKGALGNRRRMLVSQQHGVLLAGRLVRARHLAEYCGGKVARFDKSHAPVTYHHLLMPRHSLIRAEGAWAESYYPGQHSVLRLSHSARLSLLAALPELSVTDGQVTGYTPPARAYVLRRDIREGRFPLHHGALPGARLTAPRPEAQAGPATRRRSMTKRPSSKIR